MLNKLRGTNLNGREEHKIPSMPRYMYIPDTDIGNIT